MTKEELVSMAREAGFLVDYYAQQYQPNCILSTHGLIDENLQRFANLVAAHKAEPPPEWEGIKNILSEYGLQAINFVAEWKAAQPEQEPVLWMMPDGKTADKWALQFYGGQKGKPLYTTPPQRTWVGLTEEDLKLLSAEWRIVYGAWMDDFAQDIEAKLKEKNT